MKHFTKLFSSFLLLFVVLLFTACRKDDAPTAKTTLELLQNKNWKLTGLTVTPGSTGTGTEDVYNTWMEACEKDNLFRFNSGSIFILDEGPTKCDPSDPQSQNGTWDYNDAVSMLHFQIAAPSDDYTLKIVSINESGFEGKQTENVGGTTYVTTATFAKQ